MAVKSILFLGLLLATVSPALAEDFSILAYGAKADDIGLDTGAIQKALDDGGGKPSSRVIVPSGIFHIIQLNLHSHTTLHLEEKAVLESSARWEDWGSLQDQAPKESTGLLVKNFDAVTITHNSFDVRD